MRLLLFCLALVPLVNSQKEVLCPQVEGRPSCVCKSPVDGKIIDLSGSSLTNGNGVPKWSELPDSNGYVYSFNPCSTFSEILCNDVYICQESNVDPSNSFEIAKGDEKIMIQDPDNPDKDPYAYIYYTGPGDRTTKVFLHCEPDTKTPRVTTIGDSGPVILEYEFDVYGADVCPRAIEGGGAGGVAAGEAGIVLMVLLLAGVVTYFVVGAVIMKVKFQATGTDLVPNKAFWIAVPLLIKDGVLFTFSPLVNLARGKRQYSEL